MTDRESLTAPPSQPPCRECRALCDSFSVTDQAAVHPRGIIGGIICLTCGTVQMTFLQPSEADFDRARQLADERGWKDVRP